MDAVQGDGIGRILEGRLIVHQFHNSVGRGDGFLQPVIRLDQFLDGVEGVIDAANEHKEPAAFQLQKAARHKPGARQNAEGDEGPDDQFQHAGTQAPHLDGLHHFAEELAVAPLEFLRFRVLHLERLDYADAAEHLRHDIGQVGELFETLTPVAADAPGQIGNRQNDQRHHHRAADQELPTGPYREGQSHEEMEKLLRQADEHLLKRLLRAANVIGDTAHEVAAAPVLEETQRLRHQRAANGVANVRDQPPQHPTAEIFLRQRRDSHHRRQQQRNVAPAIQLVGAERDGISDFGSGLSRGLRLAAQAIFGPLQHVGEGRDEWPHDVQVHALRSRIRRHERQRQCNHQPVALGEAEDLNHPMPRAVLLQIRYSPAPRQPACANRDAIL